MAQPISAYDVQALITQLQVLLAGELQQFNRLAGGAIYPYVQTVGAGTFTNKTGAGILYGFLITTGAVGTLTAYDNTAASGNVLVNGLVTAATNNVLVPVGPAGGGLILTTGMTIVVTGASTILSLIV